MWDGGNPDCDHDARYRRRNAAAQPGSDSTKGAFLRDGAPSFDCHCGARRVDRQIGLEPTPDLYVENMVAVFREVRRVLRRDGTCWLNLGDSYASQPAGNSDATFAAKQASNAGSTERRTRSTLVAGLKPKDLLGIPWRVAFALQADGWYLRADVIWSKPNPMPESVSDRPTKAHEYLFLLTRSPRYFYDADAIREPAEWAHWGAQTNPKVDAANEEQTRGVNGTWIRHASRDEMRQKYAGGRNRRSVWEIATEPYPDAHFATFPQALVEPCVKAGTSERGACPVCGAPWERVVERGELTAQECARIRADEFNPDRAKAGDPLGNDRWANRARDGVVPNHYRPTVTTGWRPLCACSPGYAQDVPGTPYEPVPCMVLDPFMGSGTTALVARRLGRRSIGVELNETYAQLAARRLAQLSLLA